MKYLKNRLKRDEFFLEKNLKLDLTVFAYSVNFEQNYLIKRGAKLQHKIKKNRSEICKNGKSPRR